MYQYILFCTPFGASKNDLITQFCDYSVDQCKLVPVDHKLAFPTAELFPKPNISPFPLLIQEFVTVNGDDNASIWKTH